MRNRIVRSGMAVALALLAVSVVAGQQPHPQPQQPPDQPLFRSTVRTVSIYATVVDATGRLVADLQRDDFIILEDGKPVDITLFSNEPQPFTAVVMLDKSASMTANLDLLTSAAEQFLMRLLPVDRA